MIMKKIISVVLIVMLALSLCACGGEKNKTVYETENLKIDGICVDDSYADKNGRPLKMVYLFYTVNAGDTNIEIDSKNTEITIDENNTYVSDHLNSAVARKYISNYYYSSYIEDVYVGETKKIMTAFEIPEGDLELGKTITFFDSQIKDMKDIRMNTDDIQHFSSAEQLAEAMDPEGYAAEMLARENANEATTNAVKKIINGYYWEFYVNNTYYELEFSAPNNFEIRTALGKNSGTYSIKNGYIFCTYPSNQYTVEIPYKLVNGDIDLDTVSAFSVK